jgi:hypothetical protein
MTTNGTCPLSCVADSPTINISKDGVNIAQIENDDSNNPSVINENLDFSINDTNIIITIKNVTCNAGGVYTVVIIMINTTASAIKNGGIKLVLWCDAFMQKKIKKK